MSSRRSKRSKRHDQNTEMNLKLEKQLTQRRTGVPNGDVMNKSENGGSDTKLETLVRIL